MPGSPSLLLACCGTAAAALVASTEATLAVSCDGTNRVCNERTEYCDPYESTCRSCAELCYDFKKFDECERECKDFLQDTVYLRLSTIDDIRTIQILLVFLVAITIIIFLILVALLILKLQVRKRQKKEVIPLGEFPRPCTPASTVTRPLGTSLQTMTTQLSEVDSSTLSRRGGRASTHRTSRSTTRIPSEDCVPEHSYDNPAMASSPTESKSPPPTLPNGRAAPYTISHSQVI